MKAVLFFAMMLTLLISPLHFSQAAVAALKTWGLDIVPSLFPYMVLCQCLLSQLSSFPRLSLAAVPILGMLGGSPAGSAALAASTRFSSLSFRQILCLCTLTGTIGPMFFLGPVSVWLGSSTAARQLLFAHIGGALLACLIAFLLFPRSSGGGGDGIHSAQEETANPIARSISSVMNVGGCIVFYSVAASCIDLYLPFINKPLSSLFHALLEISGGLKSLSQCGIQEEMRMILCAAVSGFGGFSILSQNLLFLHPLGIRMFHLIIAGIFRAIISALIMFLLQC